MEISKIRYHVVVTTHYNMRDSDNIAEILTSYPSEMILENIVTEFSEDNPSLQIKHARVEKIYYFN